MLDLKELRITEIQEQYPGVPRDVLAPAIDTAGIVDVTQLGHIIRAFQAGVSGKVAAQGAQNAAQLRTLTTAYAEAKGRKDTGRCVSLKRQIYELGGTI